jgi:hypothetical protein
MGEEDTVQFQPSRHGTNTVDGVKVELPPASAATQRGYSPSICPAAESASGDGYAAVGSSARDIMVVSSAITHTWPYRRSFFISRLS